ncbi:MAG: hypothetical protein ACOCRK_07180 [bacterium]
MSNDCKIVVENSAPSQTRHSKSVVWACKELKNDNVSVVDFGCGRLRNVSVIMDNFNEVILVDTKKQCERIKNNKLNEFNLPLYSVESFVKLEKEYDIIFLICVLHIIPSIDKRKEIIDLITSKLKYNGFLVIDVPQAEGYYYKKLDEAEKYNDGILMGKGKVRTFYKNYYAKELEDFVQVDRELYPYRKKYFDKHITRIYRKENRVSLRNRVSPKGDLIMTECRGTLMGNRGVLHNDLKEITRVYDSKSWITCKLEYKNNKRNIMEKGKYTELFFLDEATALAAGHRPCGLCQYEKYKLFKSLWIKANGNRYNITEDNKIKDIDSIINSERIDYNHNKVTYKELLSNLVNGIMIMINSNSKKFYLLKNNYLYEWSPSGYKKKFIINKDINITVLTPRSIVNTLKEGYEISYHNSINDAKQQDVLLFK